MQQKLLQGSEPPAYINVLYLLYLSKPGLHYHFQPYGSTGQTTLHEKLKMDGYLMSRWLVFTKSQ
jgi:hypothetical protein